MSLTTPEKIRRLQRKLYALAKEHPERRFHQLYDKVYRIDILEHAYKLARSNAGAPGVDGIRFTDIEAQGRVQWLEGLQKELHETCGSSCSVVTKARQDASSDLKATTSSRPSASIAQRTFERRLHRMPRAKPVREPDAGKPHVRFDERGQETEPWTD